MKDLAIGIGLGFVLGVVLVKTCKPFNEAANKAKKMIKDKVEDIK